MASPASFRFLRLLCLLLRFPIQLAAATLPEPAGAEATCTTWIHGLSSQWGTLYGWFDAADQLDFRYPPDGQAPLPHTPTATATVITYVDVVADETSVTTVMPSDWVPPPTNSDGTQTRAVTYWSGDREYSTTIAFPTMFINWPQEYTYRACMRDPVAKTCCGPDFTITRALAEPTPQFTAGSEFNFAKGSYGDPKTLLDPKGLLAAPAQAGGPGAFPAPDLHSLWPNHPALTCKCEDQGPAWGGFITKWSVSTSTVFTS